MSLLQGILSVIRGNQATPEEIYQHQQYQALGQRDYNYRYNSPHMDNHDGLSYGNPGLFRANRSILTGEMRGIDRDPRYANAGLYTRPMYPINTSSHLNPLGYLNTPSKKNLDPFYGLSNGFMRASIKQKAHRSRNKFRDIF